MGNNGHIMLISKALYGLKTSGAWWNKKFSKTVHQLGLSPSKADHDMWMNDEGYHYSYICVYVDFLIYVGNKTNEFFA